MKYTKIYKSNRRLAKRYKKLNRISYCNQNKKQLVRLSSLKKFPYDLHDLFPGNYSLFRAVINDGEIPFNKKSRIMYNPNPKNISRANIKGLGIGYYTTGIDIGIIECSQEKLRTTSERNFNFTISEIKLTRKLQVQIICSSKTAQAAGTDLWEFYNATRVKRYKECETRADYRKWYLKTKFLADQYAKNKISCEQDYFFSAIHANTVIKTPSIDGIIYPSVPYFYSGFNYAFPLRLFQEESPFELIAVHHVEAAFNTNNPAQYPRWKLLKSTYNFQGDKILWDE